ncbi:MAG TPA: potassium channel family protein [Thermoleophilaceae bacterium]|nr:potassium channel family protein [Thermoleophilaceae bacterium]
MSSHLNLSDLDASGALPADPRQRRRLIARSALSILGLTIGLLALYALVPVPGDSSGAAALVSMIGGLLLFVVLVGWRIHRIMSDQHPVLRAIEAVTVAVPLLVVVFAFSYLTLSRADPASFSEDLGRVDAFYYTVSTLTTVGFGDITADSAGARILVTVQMLFDLALIAVLLRLVVLATRTSLRRRSARDDRPGSGE